MTNNNRRANPQSPNRRNVTNRLTTLARSDLYVAMTKSLEDVRGGDMIRLTSFQSSHPLKQNHSTEIEEYHSALELSLKDQDRQLEARRLVAIQTIEKLPWLDDVVASLGQGDCDFTLCLYPARPRWETNNQLEPLPIQTQIIADELFIGAARTTDQQSNEEMIGVHFPASKAYEQVRQYFRNHFDGLWTHAWSDSSSRLIRNGKADPDLVGKCKWRICASWLWHVLQNVTEETHLPVFLKRVVDKLLPVQDWYKEVLDTTPIRDPYRRYVLYSKGRGRLKDAGGAGKIDCEVMLARWKSGEECWPHDHGGSSGVVFILQGEARINEYIFSGGELRYDPSVTEKHLKTGDYGLVDKTTIHSMRSVGHEELVSLHVYLPEPEHIWIYDMKGLQRMLINRGGAFTPRDEAAIREQKPIRVKTTPSIDEETGKRRGRKKSGQLSGKAEEDIYVRWLSAEQNELTKAEFLRDSGETMNLEDFKRLIDRVRKRQSKSSGGNPK